MLDSLYSQCRASGSIYLEQLNSDSVKELQTVLNKFGYNSGKVDGILGNLTRKAFEKYKTDNFLGFFDEIGNGTLNQMKERLEKSEEDTPSILEDIDILARTLYGEARGETVAGRIAVAWTVVNRVKANSWWGKTIKDVCLYPWQYSCWNKNDPNMPKLKALKANTSNDVFESCITIAKKVLSEEYTDPTKGATHYYATYIKAPHWANDGTLTVTIGKHKFYKGVK